MPGRKQVNAPNAASGSNPSGSIQEALELMRHALKLLDENHAPDDVGAHLDDAVNRLEEWLRSNKAD